MFQARLPQGNLLKKLIDAIKDLITEANFDVSEAGLQLQAMDTSHVCLIALLLRSDGFEEFRWVLGSHQTHRVRVVMQLKHFAKPHQGVARHFPPHKHDSPRVVAQVPPGPAPTFPGCSCDLSCGCVLSILLQV